MAKKREIDRITGLAAKQGLLIVIVAILTLESTAILQYVSSQRILKEEASRRAEGQLEATELHILSVMSQVETAVNNSVWSVEQQLGRGGAAGHDQQVAVVAFVAVVFASEQAWDQKVFVYGDHAFSIRDTRPR